MKCAICEKHLERSYHKKNWKPKEGQKYYFKYWYRCNPCNKNYMVEEAKVTIHSNFMEQILTDLYNGKKVEGYKVTGFEKADYTTNPDGFGFMLYDYDGEKYKVFFSDGEEGLSFGETVKQFIFKPNKPIVYIDMDGVVADYDKLRATLTRVNYTSHEAKVPEGFFRSLDLIEGALEALPLLSEKYELYFLSTPQWSNPFCWSEKRLWVEDKFGELMFKRLILTHNKGLLKGDYLIDDRIANGVDAFEGEHLHFGSEKFPTWASILEYLLNE